MNDFIDMIANTIMIGIIFGLIVWIVNTFVKE